MKSARFAAVVERSGKPDVHLLLVAPEKDAPLQQAIKANRVMTLHQTGKADFGVVGFEKGVAGQILVFPKSLKSFAGLRIVGVKYDLLQDAPEPKSKSDSPKKEPKAKARKQAPFKAPKVEPPPEKVVAFQRPEPEKNADEENQRVLDLEGGIHQALELLEGGRQVAAFNVLKRLVD